MDKDLESRGYWAAFGRGAMSRQMVPTPKEAADMVLRLMSDRDLARKLVAQTREDALVALSAITAPLLEAANKVDDERESMRRRFLTLTV